MMGMRLVILAGLGLLLLQPFDPPPATLSESAAAQLMRSLEAARPYKRHVWRDTAPLHGDGTVTAYIEIPRGDRQQWEFSIPRNRRIVDRVLPREVGGYPVNYGFVPQTISYDGRPFDALVLGRALRGGALVRGEVVGVVHLEGHHGPDSKVLLSPVMLGKPIYRFTEADRTRITQFFAKHMAQQPGRFSRVTGWGPPGEGLAYVRRTHQFFRSRTAG